MTLANAARTDAVYDAAFNAALDAALSAGAGLTDAFNVATDAADAAVVATTPPTPPATPPACDCAGLWVCDAHAADAATPPVVAPWVSALCDAPIAHETKNWIDTRDMTDTVILATGMYLASVAGGMAPSAGIGPDGKPADSYVRDNAARYMTRITGILALPRDARNRGLFALRYMVTYARRAAWSALAIATSPSMPDLATKRANAARVNADTASKRRPETFAQNRKQHTAGPRVIHTSAIEPRTAPSTLVGVVSLPTDLVPHTNGMSWSPSMGAFVRVSIVSADGAARAAAARRKVS